MGLKQNKFQREPPRITLFVSSRVLSKTIRTLSPFLNSGDWPKESGIPASLTLPGKKDILLHLLTETAESLEVVKRHPMGAILLDNRNEKKGTSFGSSLAGHILPELLAGVSGTKAPLRHSILVILPDNETTAHSAYAIGTFQLGGVLVAPESIVDALLSARRISRPREPGKVALCLAGGGIEGLFYEIGVLRALDAHLEDASVVDFDIFSGISAGATIGAFLANGIKPYEIANALHGRPSRVNPVTRAMLFDPNLGEVTKRVLGTLGDMMRGKWLTSPIDTAMKVAPNSMFSGDKLRAYMKTELSKPGMHNRFSDLEKQLFIGTTDQDSGTHVTFGTRDYMDVPISTAVRASMAMTPYYDPEKIGDRYFVDGIFTRTIDIDVAVAHGARTVICVDPLTPVRSEEAGYVSGKGGTFNTVQAVKSFIRTRLTEVMDRTEEAHPDVSVFVFSPTPSDMEYMSGTMMRFFYRTDTENRAFDSADDLIRTDFEWLAADLAKHGYRLKP